MIVFLIWVLRVPKKKIDEKIAEDISSVDHFHHNKGRLVHLKPKGKMRYLRDCGHGILMLYRIRKVKPTHHCL